MRSKRAMREWGLEGWVGGEVKEKKREREAGRRGGGTARGSENQDGYWSW